MIGRPFWLLVFLLSVTSGAAACGGSECRVTCRLDSPGGRMETSLTCAEGSPSCQYENDSHGRPVRVTCRYANDLSYACDYHYNGAGHVDAIECEGEGTTCRAPN